MSKLKDFQQTKFILLVIVSLFVAFSMVSVSARLSGFLHWIMLVIHEAGHMINQPFGYLFIMIGGGLWQTLMPLAFVAYFYLTQQYFTMALTLFLVAFSLADTALYVSDAQTRALPLITDHINSHDWWNIMRTVDILAYTPFTTTLFYIQAWLIYIIALVLGIYFARNDNEL